jgi:heterocycloanthracin/sonorensin family bacteriocin
MNNFQNELQQLGVSQFQATEMTPWEQQAQYFAVQFPNGQVPVDMSRLCVGLCAGVCAGACVGFCAGFCGAFCAGVCGGFCGGFCGGVRCHNCAGFCHQCAGNCHQCGGGHRCR